MRKPFAAACAIACAMMAMPEVAADETPLVWNGPDGDASVSFGADITTWGYIKYITENNFYGGISQPCPAVVGYI